FFSCAPSGRTPVSRNLHMSISRRRATATIPTLRTRLRCLSPKVYCPGFVHLESKNCMKVEVLKSPGRLSGSKSGAASDTDPLHAHPRRDVFRQPPASRIDDANHRCALVKPNAQIGPAWKKQAASPGCLS